MKNFIKVFTDRKKQPPFSYDIAKQIKMIKDSIKYMDTRFATSTLKDDTGHMSLIMCMEELSELSQRISKYLRGMRTKEDKLLLIEEIADVELSLEYIKRITHVSKNEINLAKDIKVERQIKKMEERRLK